MTSENLDALKRWLRGHVLEALLSVIVLACPAGAIFFG